MVMCLLNVGIWLMGLQSGGAPKLPLPYALGSPCVVSSALALLPFIYFLQHVGGWSALRKRPQEVGTGADGAHAKFD